jgi:hypothetical protein
MMFDQRGSCRYLYRYERIGDRVHRRYVGTGPVAELAVTMDTRRRITQELARRELKALADRLAPASATLTEFGRAATLLARIALVTAGYHRPTRGRWRKRNGSNREDGSRR